MLSAIRRRRPACARGPCGHTQRSTEDRRSYRKHPDPRPHAERVRRCTWCTAKPCCVALPPRWPADIHPILLVCTEASAALVLADPDVGYPDPEDFI